MHLTPSSTLDDNLIGSLAVDRRGLLPKWIKVFCWIFMIMGGLIPAVFILNSLGYPAQLGLYGLATFDAFTPLGMFLALLFVIKAAIAFGLWTGKRWAVDLGLADAILGTLICCVVMFVFPLFPETWGSTIRIRLELVALIPYLLALWRIRPEWNQRNLPAVSEGELIV